MQEIEDAMTMEQLRGFRAPWHTLALVVAVMTTGPALQSAGADPLIPAPTTGTATGAYRTGLTRAGLVSVESLGNAHLWVARPSLDGDDDAGKRFDLRVELLKDGVRVASGIQQCVGGLGLAPTEVSVPWSAFDPPDLEVGDVLALRVSTRVGTVGNGAACQSKGQSSGLRLFYDSATNSSRFGAEITPSPSVDLYLRSAASLAEGAPAATPASFLDSGNVAFKNGNAWKEIGTWNLAAQADCANEFIPEVRNYPPPPEPETVVLERLPLPPPPTGGVCDLVANPQGCISAVNDAGLPIDNDHAIAMVSYAGASTSIFAGTQLIAVKMNGGTFSNGTPWKCLTCGIPAANRPGFGATAGGAGGYPQAFRDGHRLMQGNSIYQCDEPLVSDACTPLNTYRYAITWAGGAIRENKIVADDVHLGFSHVNVSGVSRLQQFGYMGRLEFNPAPTTGNPRYELQNVIRLHPQDQFEFAAAPVWPDPNNPGELLVNAFSNAMGELKAWSKDGKWVAAIPYPAESSNPDVTLIHMETGEVRRVARVPSYSEVLDVSYDNEWAVLLDTRGETGTRFGTGKELFFSGMPGIPPVTDLVQTTGMIASVRSHYRLAPHADFTPILIDLHGDRGDYVGQAIKAPSSCPVGEQGTGSLCDGSNWNTTSEAWWTPDSTKIVYKEENFGGAATSLEPGARNSRLVLVRLADREPKAFTPPAPISDVVPWAIPWTLGDPEPWRENNVPPAGTYTLRGLVFGSAQVTIEQNVSGPQPLVSQVAVSYDDYSDDGLNVINGSERVTLLTSQANIFAPALEWESGLALSGCDEGTKVSNEGGYRIRTNVLAPTGSMRATGSFITTINDQTWVNPPFLPY